MSRTIELPDRVYDALARAAEATGTSPAGWIAARLTEAGPAPIPEPPAPRPRTLADRFAGHVGLIHGGAAERLSERGGADFAEHLEAKRRGGCL